MGESRRRRDYYRQRPEQRLGDAPVQAEYHAKMEAVMHTIDEYMNGAARGPDRKVGIVVMMFPYGDVSGRCNYMSNGANRSDIVTLMREMIARFEGQPALSGKA